MKYLVTGHLDKKEKEEIEKKGLFCYDLRESDFDNDIETIEKHVWANKIGVMITSEKLEFGKAPNDFVNYLDFCLKNEQVSSIEKMLSSKENSKRKKLER